LDKTICVVSSDEIQRRYAGRRAKDQVLNAYKQGSICGTWKKLADIVYSGVSQKRK
jgi:hypothetical protein